MSKVIAFITILVAYLMLPLAMLIVALKVALIYVDNAVKELEI